MVKPLTSLVHFRGRNSRWQRRYIAPPVSAAAQAFGVLADRLCLVPVPQGGKVYLVTSCYAGEGKTTTAVNLALTLARRRRKVLLIEANLRHPCVTNIFHLNGVPGLIMFDAEAKRKDVIQQVEGWGLDVIVAGPASKEPSELFTSAMFHELLTQVRQEYDFVIMDCAAVEAHADPLFLCPLVDGVLLVVLTNRVEKEQVAMVKSKIINAGGKIVGVVLNRENALPALFARRLS